MCAETADLDVELVDLRVKGLISAGQVPQGPLGIRGGGLCFTGTERCADSYVCSDIGAS